MTRLLGKVDDALEVDLAAAADVDLLVAGAGDARAGLCKAWHVYRVGCVVIERYMLTYK